MGNFWGGLARANEPMNVRLADGSKDVPHCLCLMMMMMMMMAFQHIPTRHIPTSWEYVIMIRGGNVS